MKKIKQLSILLFIIIIYYLLNKIFHISIPCLFHYRTGLYCPGCGVTRMVFSIINLDFYQAFRYNPLLFILLFIYILIKIIEVFTKQKIKLEKFNYLLLFILITFGIMRNIPYFSFLAPTIV